MGNPFVFVELYTDDVGKSKQFYTSLLDWKTNDMDNAAVPGGKYTMISVGEGTGGGMLKNPMPNGKGSHWMPYVQVKDVAATAKKAEGLGAKVVLGKTEVMGMGWLTIISDPQGAMFGFWQSKE
jgi:predicted enzyme related to lactoylglutathione lyase